MPASSHLAGFFGQVGHMIREFGKMRNSICQVGSTFGAGTPTFPFASFAARNRFHCCTYS